jgi:hypothetical protein
MESVTPPRARGRTITQRDVMIDQNLPRWARRSNPVIRRELGEFWKYLLPNVRLVAKLLGLQAILLLLMPLVLLMNITLPVAVVSVLVVPAAVLLYGRTLLNVIHSTAAAIVDATNNHTLDLLRVSLLPLHYIILGKIAAGLWRRMEDLDLILTGLLFVGMPVVTAYYLAPLSPDEITLTARTLATLVIFVLPARVMLEPFMFGALALAIGASTHSRAGTVVTVTGIAVFYYVLLVLLLMANLSLMSMYLTDVILPLGLPLGVTVGCVRFAAWRIRHPG